MFICRKLNPVLVKASRDLLQDIEWFTKFLGELKKLWIKLTSVTPKTVP